MNALTRSMIAIDAAREKEETMCRVRSPRALQATLIGDKRDADVMRAVEDVRQGFRATTPAERLACFPYSYGAL